MMAQEERQFWADAYNVRLKYSGKVMDDDVFADMVYETSRMYEKYTGTVSEELILNILSGIREAFNDEFMQHMPVYARSPKDRAC